MPNFGGNNVDVGGGSKNHGFEAKSYPAYLVQIVHAGVINNNFKDKETGEPVPPFDTTFFTFEFPTVRRKKDDGTDEASWRTRDLKTSASMNSNFYKFCCAFDPSYQDGDNISEFLGKPCAVTVGFTKNGTGVPRPQSIQPLMEGFQIAPIEHDTTMFSVASPNLSEFEKLPDWLQKICKNNINFEGSEFQKLLEIGADAESEGDFDDDIPF